MSMIAVGVYLRALRERKGISRKALAKAVGISVPRIQRIEQGKADPPASVLFALATMLDAAPDDLQRLFTDEQPYIQIESIFESSGGMGKKSLFMHEPGLRIAGLHAGAYQVSDDFDDYLPEGFLITGE